MQNREIKISLCLLNFEGCGTLDLGEIYQFGPWKRFAFDFRQHPFLRTQLDSRTTVEPNAEGKTCNDGLSTSSPLWRVPLTRTLYFHWAT